MADKGIGDRINDLGIAGTEFGVEKILLDDVIPKHENNHTPGEACWTG